MMDYVDWRGDLSAAVSPWNEIDQLIFAYLSYVDFDGVLAGPKRTLQEVCTDYFALHTREELKARTTFYKQAPFLMEKAAHSDRYRNICLSDYVNQVNEQKEAQMSAVTIWIDDTHAYVSFRGTDDTFVGWREDFNLSYLSETPGQKAALQYVNEHFSGKKHVTIDMGGHSKGGNFAIYAGAFCDPSIPVRYIFSFDAPGFIDEITQTEAYQALLPKVISVIPEEAVIGVLLSNNLENTIVKSTERGVMQHDAMSWQVMRDHFDRAENRTAMSLFFDQTMRTWVAKFDAQQRKAFCDALFSFFEETSTLTDFNAHKVQSIGNVMKTLGNMPKEQRQMFFNFLMQLADSGRRTLVDELRRKITG